MTDCHEVLCRIYLYKILNTQRKAGFRLTVLSELILFFYNFSIKFYQYYYILFTPLVSLQDCGFQRFLKQDSSKSKDSLSEYTIQNSNISECSERANGEHSERNSEQVGPNIYES